jgi:quinol monooxygenase YgiN
MIPPQRPARAAGRRPERTIRVADPISVVAVALARPDAIATVEAAIRRCIPETRKEEGCLLYTAHQDLDQPGRFVFIERWTGRDALDLHTKTPHFLALAETVVPLLTEPLSISVLSELD